MLAPKLRAKRNKSGVSNAEIEQKAKALLATVGLTEKENAYPCRLSGGQQQRVAIARALMLSPDILCFDEPTSSLDPELTGEVLRVIRSLKDSERTMIIVTHEMEFARHVSDRIIFIADGIIEEEGSPDEVFGNPKSEKLKAFLSAGEK
jgi:polar amino acid transport system ATP-binding protein